MSTLSNTLKTKTATQLSPPNQLNIESNNLDVVKLTLNIKRKDTTNRWIVLYMLSGHK